MAMIQQALQTPLFLPHSEIDVLISLLQQNGFRVVGPQARDGSIVYDDLQTARALPWGLRDKQHPGGYQLENIHSSRAFAFSVGNQGLKPFLFKPSETVWRVERNKEGKLQFIPHVENDQPIAFFGARSCDLRALSIQDRVFIDNDYPDKAYHYRRQGLFLIAIDCGYSSANCFCLSAGGSPKVQDPSDITMTEIDNGFVISSLSQRGEKIISEMQLQTARTAQIKAAEDEVKQAMSMQTKRIPKNNQPILKEILFNNLDHPQWEDVASRCLSCGNCTNSCPTCFCHTQVENPQLDGEASSHERQWDSCFNAGHSYFARQVLRKDTQSRYKQWLTHKVGSWFDQFGCSGCVGCGRCIAWCPTGIDLTEELSAITGETNTRSDHDS